jgi:hypothetical protein
VANWPEGLFDYDPVLLARLKPNASGEMHVLGRRLTMDVDASGCRPVTDQRNASERKYICSAWLLLHLRAGVAAKETFCSLLQGMLPTWRVENRGVPAYSTSRNLIQLERETRWDRQSFVTFCWIDDHLRRNVADITWVQLMSDYSLPPGADPENLVPLPRAALDANGALAMRSVGFPRHDLVGIDFSDFTPDPFYLDLVCFRLFERANAIVTKNGGHFFVTTLWGSLSAALARLLAEKKIPVLGVSRRQRISFPPRRSSAHSACSQYLCGPHPRLPLAVSG